MNILIPGDSRMNALDHKTVNLAELRTDPTFDFSMKDIEFIPPDARAEFLEDYNTLWKLPEILRDDTAIWAHDLRPVDGEFAKRAYHKSVTFLDGALRFRGNYAQFTALPTISLAREEGHYSYRDKLNAFKLESGQSLFDFLGEHSVNKGTLQIQRSIMFVPVARPKGFGQERFYQSNFSLSYDFHVTTPYRFHTIMENKPRITWVGTHNVTILDKRQEGDRSHPFFEARPITDLIDTEKLILNPYSGLMTIIAQPVFPLQEQRASIISAVQD